ncbi:hypothetical protein XENTR_v10010421 [Xenopus tropicalis]|nr:hypothetical protein XENTR_v10010421 [Xenopus tropicalis]
MVAVADANLHASLSRLLTSLGIHLQEALFQDWTLHTDFIFSSKMAQKCHVCKKRSFETPVKICGRCQAALYCSDRCRSSDSGHQSSCALMQECMEREEELANHPFQFSKEVTSPWFDKERFLSARQLTGGYWSSESIHHHARGLLLKRDGQEPEEERPEALMEDTDIMLRDYPTEGPKNILGTWKEYYEWRNLSLDNPIAALLSYPLTIYHVISSLLPQHFPALNFQKKQTLRIHIIAGRREFERILLFWELAVLMPHPTIELVFVGEELPPEEDGRSFILHRKGPQVQRSDLSGPAKGKDGRQIHVKVHAHQYHSLQAAKPDLILGFNPGFWLHDSWLSTLPRIQAQKVPAYFSECSQYSCGVDAQTVLMATGGDITPPTLNPFRSPLRIPGSDNCMPWYNNAFLFHLIHKETKQGRHPEAPRLVLADPQTCRKKKKQRQKQCKKRK